MAALLLSRLNEALLCEPQLSPPHDSALTWATVIAPLPPAAQLRACTCPDPSSSTAGCLWPPGPTGSTSQSACVLTAVSQRPGFLRGLWASTLLTWIAPAGACTSPHCPLHEAEAVSLLVSPAGLHAACQVGRWRPELSPCLAPVCSALCSLCFLGFWAPRRVSASERLPSGLLCPWGGSQPLHPLSHSRSLCLGVAWNPWGQGHSLCHHFPSTQQSVLPTCVCRVNQQINDTRPKSMGVANLWLQRIPVTACACTGSS